MTNYGYTYNLLITSLKIKKISQLPKVSKEVYVMVYVFQYKLT